MTLQDVIKLLSSKLAALNSAKATATTVGDFDRIVALERDIEETQNTLYRLQVISEV
jgi:hypothetical protein